MRRVLEYQLWNRGNFFVFCINNAYDKCKSVLKMQFILLFIFVGGSKIACSQGYINMVDSSSLYNYYRISNGPFPSYSVCYKFGNDTTISSLNCTEVLYSLDTVSWYSAGAYLHEDSINQQVFLLTNDTIGLIYDYSADVGDTVYVYNPLYGLNTIPLKVNSVDSVYFDGDYHKTLRFDNYFWIEGIGDIEIGLLYSGSDAVGSFVESLVCYYKDDNLAYSNPIFTSCFFTTDIKSCSNDTFDCYFSNSQLYYKSKDQIISLVIYNNVGQVVFKTIVNNNNGYITIPSSLCGLYLFEFNFSDSQPIIKKYHL